MLDRLRKIVLPVAEYNALPGDFDRMGEELARRAGVDDLVVTNVRPNGNEIRIFVHSQSFEVEPCECRAPLQTLRG